MKGARNRMMQNVEAESRQEQVQHEYEKNLTRMREIYKNFQTNLTKYAEKYQHEIATNREARAKFNNLCQDMGIDPVVSKKNMWGNLFGDFYNSLAVQILRICEKTKSTNGG